MFICLITLKLTWYFRTVMLSDGLPVHPGVGHVVDQLEHDGQGGRDQEQGGRGSQSSGEAQEPDCSPEPSRQVQNKVLPWQTSITNDTSDSSTNSIRYWVVGQ